MNWQSVVKMFHQKMNQDAPDVLRAPSDRLRDLRFYICRQEHVELEQALSKGSLTDIAHESIDVIVTALGNLVACGIDGDAVFQEVMRANMAKEPGPDGGKAVKPEGWTKPDVEGVLRRQSRGWNAGEMEFIERAHAECGDAGDEHSDPGDWVGRARKLEKGEEIAERFRRAGIRRQV